MRPNFRGKREGAVGAFAVQELGVPEDSSVLLAQAQPNITISHAAYTLTSHLLVCFVLI